MAWAWTKRVRDLEEESAKLRKQVEKLNGVELNPPTYCPNCGHVNLKGEKGLKPVRL